MGRRKRNRHLWNMTKRKQEKAQVKTNEEEEEEAFYNLVDDSGFTLPHEFRNWKAHFKSRKSFLEEACCWIKGQYDGIDIQVIPDVQKNLNSYNTQLVKNGCVTEFDEFLYDREDINYSYDEMDIYMGRYTKRPKWRPGVGYTNYWQGTLFNRQLPLTPKIEAPTGLSGKKLVVL